MGRKAESEGSEFWQRLVEAWGARGLPTSQNGVAKKLEMDGNGSTGRWFRGEGYPELETLAKIARLGNVTVDWLLTERLPKHPVDPRTALGYIHENWDQLGERNEQHVLESFEGRLAVAQRDQPPQKHPKTSK